MLLMGQADLQNTSNTPSSPSITSRRRRLVDHTRSPNILSSPDSSQLLSEKDDQFDDSRHADSTREKAMDGTKPIEIPTFRSFRSSEKLRFDLSKDGSGTTRQCSLQEEEEDVVEFFLKVEPREIRQKKSSSERVKILRDTFNKKGNSMRSIGRPPSLADTIKKISRPRSLPCLSGTPTQ
mmetsp:Transcript_23027/g.53421  ORF Transcript_23027/g.53421 Transcript_23027/m.53421 type:complete len:180 (-) Transcript_23027:635-1174(-)